MRRPDGWLRRGIRVDAVDRVVSFVGIVTSLPDDRHFDFLMVVGGGLLWGILGATAVTARVLQWRMLRRAAAIQQLA